MEKIRGLHIFILVLAALAIAVMQVKPYESGPPIGDAYDYLSVAETLYTDGVFTDGNQGRDAVATGPNGEGLFFSPGYPAMVTAFMHLDPTFKETAFCLNENRFAENRDALCAKGYGSFLWFQALLVATSFVLIWFCAHSMTGKYSVSWLAFIIATAAGIYGFYAQNFFVEPLVVPFFTAACLGLIYCLKNPRALTFFLTGVFFGLTVLVRPSFTYPFYGFLIIACIALLITMPKKQALLLLIAAVGGYALTAGPWIIRNGMLFDIWAVSAGYAPFILVQRVSYNMMSWAEVGVALVYWFPDFGDSLAKDWFPKELYTKLDFANPQGYYVDGKSGFKAAAIDAAGGRENLFSYLLSTYVLGDFAKHIGVTFALLWRGMWIEKYWGLICLSLLLGTGLAQTLKKKYALLIFAAPALFMAGLHAFVSVSIPRYNIVMVPALSIGAAIALVALASWIMKKRNKAQ